MTASFGKTAEDLTRRAVEPGRSPKTGPAPTLGSIGKEIAAELPKKQGFAPTRIIEDELKSYPFSLSVSVTRA